MLTIHDYTSRSEGFCNCTHNCSDKLTPSLNPGRWDLDAPDPGPWENIILDIYIYKYTCTKIRLFLSISIHLNTKYIDILWRGMHFFNGWWSDSSSLIVHHDSHFVYWFVWFKCISIHVWMPPMFFWFSLVL